MTDLSVIVVAYNMTRELPRTIQSLARPYQIATENLSYEIIVVDNYSSIPVDVDLLQAIAPEVRVIRTEKADASPAIAANIGIKSAKGRFIGIILDGARMVTPGTLSLAYKALSMDEDCFVTTLAWHLGPDHQSRSQFAGYNSKIEDQLLNSIDWSKNGYKLFDIAALAGANPSGWFGPVNESCCTFLSKKSIQKLGGYDEVFRTPGGGFVNLDFFSRAIEVHGMPLIVLLGEGSFHQIHGGAASNAKDPEKISRLFAEEYERIRGRPYRAFEVKPFYIGNFSIPARKWLERERVSQPLSISPPQKRNVSSYIKKICHIRSYFH